MIPMAMLLLKMSPTGTYKIYYFKSLNAGNIITYKIFCLSSECWKYHLDNSESGNSLLKLVFSFMGASLWPLVLMDRHTQSSEVEATGIKDKVAFKHVSLDGNSEDEIIAFSSGKQLRVAASNYMNNSLHQQLADELADLGDDAASIVLPINSITRRKLRMIS